MIEFGFLCLMLAGAIGVITLAGALATRIAHRDEDGDRRCPCGEGHPTLSEELAAHGDPPS